MSACLSPTCAPDQIRITRLSRHSRPTGMSPPTDARANGGISDQKMATTFLCTNRFSATNPLHSQLPHFFLNILRLSLWLQSRLSSARKCLTLFRRFPVTTISTTDGKTENQIISRHPAPLHPDIKTPSSLCLSFHETDTLPIGKRPHSWLVPCRRVILFYRSLYEIHHQTEPDCRGLV